MNQLQVKLPTRLVNQLRERKISDRKIHDTVVAALWHLIHEPPILPQKPGETLSSYIVRATKVTKRNAPYVGNMTWKEWTALGDAGQEALWNKWYQEAEEDLDEIGQNAKARVKNVLLDKNVVRKFLRALEKKGLGIALDASEKLAVATVDTELAQGKRLFIVPETDNVLSLFFGERKEVRLFREHVEVIVGGRYYKRWARRLEDFGFTREDARVLSSGTFGTDDEVSFVGVGQVLTFDKPLATLFDQEYERIQNRLNAMKRDLDSPYDDAKLPEVTLLGLHKKKSA